MHCPQGCRLHQPNPRRRRPVFKCRGGSTRRPPARRLLARLAWPIGLAGLLAVAGMLWRFGLEPQALSIVGVVSLTIGLFAGVALLRLVFSGSHPVVGVARAIVEEAIGTRLSILLAVLVIVDAPHAAVAAGSVGEAGVPDSILPGMRHPGSAVLLSIMSIALCCGSICGDIESRRIHMSLSEAPAPLGVRARQMVGVVALQLVLVTLMGIGVYRVCGRPGPPPGGRRSGSPCRR